MREGADEGGGRMREGVDEGGGWMREETHLTTFFCPAASASSSSSSWSEQTRGNVVHRFTTRIKKALRKQLHGRDPVWNP
jgi:hypothetical protein